MGKLVTIDISLIKEAHDIVSEMKEEIVSLKNQLDVEHKELIQLKNISEREKLASILDEKGLIPYNKVVDLREGKISKEEFENLKNLAQVNLEYATSSHNPTKIASEEFFDTSQGQRVFAREQRAQQLFDDLQALKNNY